jgi:hypothetical protein
MLDFAKKPEWDGRQRRVTQGTIGCPPSASPSTGPPSWSVLWTPGSGSLSRIWIFFPSRIWISVSRFFHPGPGFFFPGSGFSIPDLDFFIPDSGSRFFHPRSGFFFPGSGFSIPNLDFFIPDLDFLSRIWIFLSRIRIVMSRILIRDAELTKKLSNLNPRNCY